MGATMKYNIVGFSPLILALAVLFGCADDEVAADDDGDLDARTAFHRAVGAAIPQDTAHAWMNNYRIANPNRIRSHFFGADAFHALLAREGIVGISLEYAINDAGEPQIILIGIDAAGHYMLSPPNSVDGKRSSAGEAYDASSPCPNQCPTYDTTTTTTTTTTTKGAAVIDRGPAFHRAVGAAIPHDTAHAWMNNYRTANPNRIRSHFFGVDTFHALLAREGIVGISLEYALNDAGEPQIILIGIDAAGHYMLSPGGGKRALEGSAYDASVKCPYTCPSYEYE
jgi:hypothetical protein